MAFNGTFDHSLDAKNRVTIPSRFRSTLAGTVFLARGSEPCLSVYPEAEYVRLTEQSLAGLAPLSAQYKQYRRLFNAWAMEVELDSAGRIQLQPMHLEHAGIEGREVTVAGAGECLEVWDRAAWQRYEIELGSVAPELTASLGHPG